MSEVSLLSRKDAQTTGSLRWHMDIFYSNSFDSLSYI